jgi:hypothetical protein
MIDISKADKAAVLQALVNGCHNAINHGPVTAAMQSLLPKMTLDEARAYIEATPGLYFDYVECRALKVRLTGPELDERLYDRDSGPGAARRALRDVPGVEFEGQP